MSRRGPSARTTACSCRQVDAPASERHTPSSSLAWGKTQGHPFNARAGRVGELEPARPPQLVTRTLRMVLLSALGALSFTSCGVAKRSKRADDCLQRQAGQRASIGGTPRALPSPGELLRGTPPTPGRVGWESLNRRGHRSWLHERCAWCYCHT